ncbi:MAG: hypothetical protein QOG41_755 [Thermoleophilaceae bacterium]|jgi:hypothetical protein|nr:hypothetical protein [Thermoleophilaceae bacterium]MEA2352428.1 hypothetical protein [Thermoleophilaceae bacterium]MEA2387982.1 hypothetical protein [Thermoleophilaceae bacterium]
MADEIELHFIDDEPPAAALQRWRTDPPALIREGRFEIIDESYNSLTFESRFFDTPMKVLMVATLGLGWLMSKITPMQSIWKFTVRFDSEGEGDRRTKVTILGHASEETRAALGEVAAEHGGAVDLRVGA